jgi:hypothetical protein
MNRSVGAEPAGFFARFDAIKESGMAKKQSSRGRKQDRARVAGGQDYEARYEAKKTGRSAASVKKAVKKVGNSRKRVESTLGR